MIDPKKVEALLQKLKYRRSEIDDVYANSKTLEDLLVLLSKQDNGKNNKKKG